MSKFNTSETRPRAWSPITTSAVATTTTYEGHPGYTRDAKSELFLLAVSNFVSENTFYEKAGDRDARFAALVQQNTVEDPEWTANLLRWLRGDGNMRSASIVGAAEYARAALGAEIPGSRAVINSVLLRADEPGELVAYWRSKYGRTLPNPVKRGVGDALIKLGTEFNYLKYGTREGAGYSIADLLNLCHPGESHAGSQVARGEWQRSLFAYVVHHPHDKDAPIPEALGMLTRRQALMAMPVDERRQALEPLRLKEAGMTWEALAGWLQGPMDRAAWEAIIPNMGIMARIRNLRNFDEAGVGPELATQICEQLVDPAAVAGSRQLPYRWFSAYREAPSDRWRQALNNALDLSTRNLPALPGRTLILVDTSGSMSAVGYSARSKVAPVHTAALFGVALANRCGPENVDLHGFADGTFAHPLRKGGSVLREVERFAGRIGEVGHGTQTAEAVKRTFNGHARVVVITDEQSFGVRRYWGNGAEVADTAPANVPMYAFNLGGYAQGMLPDKPNRHQLGGLTDHTFRMIPLLEQGRDGVWPWEQTG